MKINLKKQRITIGFMIILLFILMRPVLNTYTHNIDKYIFVIVALIGLVYALPSKRTYKVITIKETLAIISWCLFVFINSVINGGFELFRIAFQCFILFLFPMFVIPRYFFNINWDKVLTFLSIFGCVDSFVSFYEFFSNRILFPINDGEQHLVRQYNGSIRTYGLNGSYFILAEILCLCGFAAICKVKYQKKKIYIIAFIIISLGVLSTGTRGYYVAYFIGLIYIYLKDLNDKFSVKKLARILVVCFALIAIYAFIMSRITTGNLTIDLILLRIRNIFNWTNESANVTRISIWKKSYKLWLERPIFGHGAGATESTYSGYLGVTESGFLRRLVELGIMGTAIQYFSLFYPLYIYHKRISYKNPENYICVFFLAFLICTFIEDFILQMFGGIEYTLIVWSCIGYLLSYSYYCKPKMNRVVRG